jgi:hypothetical protein
VTKIERPVHMRQGLGDTLVAPFINRTIAERMRWRGLASGRKRQALCCGLRSGRHFRHCGERIARVMQAPRCESVIID